MSALSFSLLRSPNFQIYLMVRVFVIMAAQAQAVIVGWQVYSISHSVFLIGLTEAVPAIACAFFSGYVVDISRPYRVYLSCIAALALNAFFLLLLGGGYVGLEGRVLLPWIFGAIFISGMLRSFIMPAGFAIIGHMVARDKMTAALAWTNSGFQLAAVTGPAMAGLIYGGYGPGIAWAMPVTLMTAAALLLLGMDKFAKHRRGTPRAESALKSIRSGWSFIFGHRVLLSIMALDMFAVLFGGATAMLPAFADQVLHVGSEGLGLLRASPALGSVSMALFLAVRPLHNIRPSLLLWMVSGFGLAMIGFGLSTIFPLAAFCLVVSGAFDSVSVVVRGTLIQWLTPEEMKGRVSAVGSMFIISSNEIGAFESGAAAGFFGLVPSIILGGCATLLVVAVTALSCPELRRLTINAHGHKSH